ncbi:MAG: isoprenyl transferase [Chitinophagales bacterium]
MENQPQHIDYKSLINLNKLPKHIAIIMDGNGRWAQEKGKHRIFGHKNGVSAVRATTEACAELGVQHLTLYAFSTENWNRPQTEVSALMELLFLTIGKEIKTLQKNNIKLSAIGNIDTLPEKSQKALLKAIDETKYNTRMTLHLALSYGSREEILQATKKIAEAYKLGKININQINETDFDQYLYTKNIPDPELLIRTSGEQRISNFLLWQIAYAELYFTDKFWPDFNKEDIYQAIYDYQNRERRFGKTSKQIEENA